jgi:hypothetical protein
MFDLIDPNTFWLNVTNVTLGAVTLVCCIVVGYGVVQEIRKRICEYKTNHFKTDDYRLFLTNLGITITNGGERIDKKQLTVSEKGLVRDSKPRSKRRSKKQKNFDIYRYI